LKSNLAEEVVSDWMQIKLFIFSAESIYQMVDSYAGFGAQPFDKLSHRRTSGGGVVFAAGALRLKSGQ